MKHRFLIIPLLALAVCASAANNDRLTHSHGRPYSLSVLGEYGYNTTFSHYGGAVVSAFMPVHDKAEIIATVEGISANTYSIGTTVRPKFALPVGEMFFDATAFYRCDVRDQIHDFVGAMSVGYRMDYVSFQVGCFSRTAAPFDRTWNGDDQLVTEPFNLMYRLSVNVRPLCERWNIYFGGANFTETEYERMWQPVFFLGGYYDFKPSSNFEYEYNAASHFRLLAEISCKPTGMFHLNANFYGARARFGFAYKF